MPNELNHVTSILTLDADAQLETPQSKADHRPFRSGRVMLYAACV